MTIGGTAVEDGVLTASHTLGDADGVGTVSTNGSARVDGHGTS